MYMKKFLLYTTALLFTILATTSCNDDEPSISPQPEPIQSYATIEADQQDGTHTARRDDGTKLIFINLGTNSFNATIGQRYLIKYYIVDETTWSSIENVFEETAYEVVLHSMESVTPKGIVEQSFINADLARREDSLGQNPIVNPYFLVTKATLSSKYLNLDILYISPYSLSVGVNKTSLVYDDIALDAQNNVVLTVRQKNVYEDHPEVVNSIPIVERFSFDLTSIVPEGQTSAKILLKWITKSSNDVEPVTKSATATFHLPSASSSRAEIGRGEYTIYNQTAE